MSNTKDNIILTCVGFHRSATSVTAQWVHKSGITMGNWLMPAAKSNSDGHFEDMPMVALNDNILKLQNTSWCFHDEVPLSDSLAPKQYELYINRRDRIHQNQQWGVKDPRLSLFLPEWHEATKGRSRYLIVIRHWTECINSLIKRDIDSAQAVFHSQPEITAKMWYSYNIRLLEFSINHPNLCLFIEQADLNKNIPLLINERFGTTLLENTLSPFNKDLINNSTENNFKVDFLTKKDKDLLDNLWQKLTSCTTKAKNYPVPHRLYVSLNKKQALTSLTTQNNKVKVAKHASNEEYIELARNAMFKLDWATAEEALEKLIIYNLPPPYVYALLAECKYNLNLSNDAVLLYEKSIQLNPSNPNFFLKLANLHTNEGEFDKAKAVLKSGIKNSPEKSHWLRKSLSTLE
jgi:tetratricopeptide (TPR) repeat protein